MELILGDIRIEGEFNLESGLMLHTPKKPLVSDPDVEDCDTLNEASEVVTGKLLKIIEEDFATTKFRKLAELNEY